KFKCVPKEKLIDGGASRIGVATFGDATFAVVLRVDVEAAARKQHALRAGDEVCDALLQFGERNYNRQHSGGSERINIRSERALVVFLVRAGDWNGDRNGHGS